MRGIFISPRPNLLLSEPIGNAIRIQELINGFKIIGIDIFKISAAENQAAHQAKRIYRTGFRQILPERMSGTMRDLFYVAHDQIFMRNAQRIAQSFSPLDFILENYTFFCQTGITVSRKLHTPLILDDIVPIWEAEVYYRRDLKFIARKIQENVFKNATACIAVSGEIREYLISCNVPKEKIYIVGNGADCDRFIPGAGEDKIREIYNIQDKVVIGFVGSFAPWHGLDLLISCIKEIASQSNNIHFFVVGDGTRKNELEKKVKEDNIQDKITFTGSIPFENIPSYIDAMDVTVVPNTISYCSPIKIFEYMAMEKPVVAPKFNPIKEIITDNVDGKLFTPGDQYELGQAIIDLASCERKRHEMGILARQKIIDNFTWAKQAERICKIIVPSD